MRIRRREKKVFLIIIRIGGLAFAFVAATVIVLRYLMNDTIQTEEDIKKYLGLHMLAAIPTEKRESI